MAEESQYDFDKLPRVYTVEFAEPITLGKTTHTCIELHAPTLKEWTQAKKLAGGANATQEQFFTQLLYSQVKDTFLADALPIDAFAEASEYFSAFLGLPSKLSKLLARG